MIINIHNTFLQIVETKNILKRLFNFLSKKLIITNNESSLDEIKKKELLENLNSAQIEWKCASINFNFANEDELVDYYIYKIKATQTKYDFLLKKAKENGL